MRKKAFFAFLQNGAKSPKGPFAAAPADKLARAHGGAEAAATEYKSCLGSHRRREKAKEGNFKPD